jgi:hypothetical protein
LELHDAFEVMRSKLTAAYGGHVTMDTLLPGSIWSEPNEWMMGLLKKERVLGALWGTEQGSSLPTDLKSIGMMAFATTLDKGYITVEYYFTNFDSCEVELNAEEDDGL